MVKKTTYQLIKQIVETINVTFKGDTITDEGAGIYTITSCDIKWITLNMVLTIGANTYRVIDIAQFESIRIKCQESPAVAPIIATFDIGLPYYWKGPLYFTSAELSQIQTANLKYPMIYLLSPSNENDSGDIFSTIEMESQCDFFIMGQANYKDWTIEQHRKYACEPMRNLALEFIEAMRKATGIIEQVSFTENGQDLKECIKWGLYGDKGSEKKFFSDDVSGYELKINIPFLKQAVCGC